MCDQKKKKNQNVSRLCYSVCWGQLCFVLCKLKYLNSAQHLGGLNTLSQWTGGRVLRRVLVNLIL